MNFLFCLTRPGGLAETLRNYRVKLPVVIFVYVVLQLYPFYEYISKRKIANRLLQQAPMKNWVGMPEVDAVALMTQLCKPQIKHPRFPQTLPDGSHEYVWSINVPGVVFAPLVPFPAFCSYTAVCVLVCNKEVVTSFRTYKL